MFPSVSCKFAYLATGNFDLFTMLNLVFTLITLMYIVAGKRAKIRAIAKELNIPTESTKSSALRNIAVSPLMVPGQIESAEEEL